jgi:hypothetical protein
MGWMVGGMTMTTKRKGDNHDRGDVHQEEGDNNTQDKEGEGTPTSTLHHCCKQLFTGWIWGASARW